MRRSLIVTVLFAALLASPIAGRQADLRSTLIDAQKLLHDLQTLSADDMEGRQIGTPGGARARAFVVEQFKASGIQPFGDSYEQPFTYMGGRRGAAQTEQQGVNVIGRIDGTKTPKRYIVISGHYDHIGTRNGTVLNGADDNASGAARCSRSRSTSARTSPPTR